MNYLTRNGQTIYDLVLNTNGDLNKTYAVIQDNPTIKNIGSVPVGLVVSYEASQVTPPSVSSITFSDPSTTEKYFSRNNQTIYDIVLMTYGDLNLTYKLIQDSNFSNLQTAPKPTNLFIFNPLQISDTVFSKYLSDNGIVINTGQLGVSISTSGGLLTDGGNQIQTDGGIDIIID